MSSPLRIEEINDKAFCVRWNRNVNPRAADFKRAIDIAFNRLSMPQLGFYSSESKTITWLMAEAYYQLRDVDWLLRDRLRGVDGFVVQTRDAAEWLLGEIEKELVLLALGA